MDSYRGKKVFITGAAGFIGSHLTETLAIEGAVVKSLVHYNSLGSIGNLECLPNSVRKSVEIVLGDIRDSNFIEKEIAGSEFVFHLAALIGIPYSYHAPNSYVDTNIVGTVNVLQACRKANVQKMIHTSTSEVYGTAVYKPINEEHPLQGQSPYSASKIGADKMAESFHRSYGLPLVTVRPFNTYGPRQSARAIIPTIISQCLSDARSLKLGSTQPKRDFTYVGDTVRGFMAAASSKTVNGDVVNLGTGKYISIGELADLILKKSNRLIKIEIDQSRVRPKNSEVMELLCDPTKAFEKCSWKASVTIEEGLQNTIQFMQENLLKFKPTIYNV